jgi:hypothetical protein
MCNFCPPSVQDYVPSDHLDRFVVELVRENLVLRRSRGAIAVR